MAGRTRGSPGSVQSASPGYPLQGRSRIRPPAGVPLREARASELDPIASAGLAALHLCGTAGDPWRGSGAAGGRSEDGSLRDLLTPDGPDLEYVMKLLSFPAGKTGALSTCEIVQARQEGAG